MYESEPMSNSAQVSTEFISNIQSIDSIVSSCLQSANLIEEKINRIKDCTTCENETVSDQLPPVPNDIHGKLCEIYRFLVKLDGNLCAINHNLVSILGQ